MKYNYKITLAYDGAKYSGWQRNKNATNTIQSKLDETFSKYFGHKVEIIGAGRTDKGVHAHGMVANFHTTHEVNCNKAKKELNQFLTSDILIKDIVHVEDRFHSRLNAVGKCYTYTFAKGYEGVKPLFDRHYVGILDEKVNVKAMLKASELFIGKHDFKGFSSDRTKKSTVREIYGINITEDEEYVTFEFKGNGFLYHMVRILTGTLIEVGTSKRSIESINKVLESGIRSEAGYLVPADGLFLDEVYYEKADLFN